MGGTLIRLVEDQHEVHVAYMTSGNIAVFDHDARRVADLVTEFNRRFGIDVEKTPRLEDARAQAPGRQDGRASPTADDVLQDQGADPLERGQGRPPASAAARKSICTSSICRSTTPARSPRSRSPTTTSRIVRELIERRRARARSTWPATCPTRTARTASAPRSIFRALRQIEADTRQPARGAALSRRVAGMGAARDRHRRAA